MITTDSYILDCHYDARASFYGKAKVIEVFKDGVIIEKKLISYNTHVASIKYVDGVAKPEYYGSYSQTTTRHQKEFFRQNGFYAKDYFERAKERIMNKEKI